MRPGVCYFYDFILHPILGYPFLMNSNELQKIRVSHFYPMNLQAIR